MPSIGRVSRGDSESDGPEAQNLPFRRALPNSPKLALWGLLMPSIGMVFRGDSESDGPNSFLNLASVGLRAKKKPGGSMKKSWLLITRRHRIRFFMKFRAGYNDSRPKRTNVGRFRVR